MVTFTKPTINADDDAWGAILNADLDTLNTLFPDVATLLLTSGGNTLQHLINSNEWRVLFNGTQRAKMTAGGLWVPNGLALPSGGTLTIASDTITVGAFSRYSVDTEAAASSDNLTTINGGTAGQILLLSCVNAARTVQLVDGSGIRLVGSANFTLNHDEDIALLYAVNSSVWFGLVVANVS